MRLYDKAKQRSLLDFAQNNGYPLRKQGAAYAGAHCPHCISKNAMSDALSVFPKGGVWRWNCFRCKRGGSVVDFAAAVWGVTEKEAAMRLANDESLDEAQSTSQAAPKPEARKVDNVVLAETLTLLAKKAQTNVSECFEYLASRGIERATVEQAVLRGMLRFLPASAFQARKLLNERVGVERLLQSGLLKEGGTWPAIAFRPLVFFFPGGSAAEFRLIRPPKEGEPKAIRYGHSKWPWFWKKDEKGTVHTIYIVEGAIDLLSMVEMGLKEGEAVLAMPGTGTWQAKWFELLHELYPKARYILALDSDTGGRKAAQGIAEVLDPLGVPIMELAPSMGSDWNEHLVAFKGIKAA